MGDTSIKFEVIPGKNQKSEYVMTCGKHTVRGWCKYGVSACAFPEAGAEPDPSCVSDTRQEQEGWQAASVSEDPADASSSC